MPRFPIYTIFFLFTVLLSLELVIANSAFSDSIICAKIGNSDSSSDLFNVFVAPKNDLIVIQFKNLNTQNLEITLLDSTGIEIKRTILFQASTIAYFDTQTLYSGEYTVIVSDGDSFIKKRISLIK